MKKALITGDQGFVARHMRPMLEKAGYEVWGFDVKPNPSLGFSQKSIPSLDARDFFRNDTTSPELVIHLAAVVGGRQKIEGAPLDLAVDLSIDAEMFSWAMRTRPKKIVYFSSSAAYPIALQSDERVQELAQMNQTVYLNEMNIDLSSIRMPDLTYGWAKLTGEMLAQHARNAGLDVLVVRPFSGYGEDQALDYPFPSLIKRVKRRADPFEVWGSGTQVRDWIHIDDICEATLAAVEQGIEGPVNLCTGVGTSFIDLVEMICKEAGYEPEVKPLPDKPAGVHTRVGDPGKMLSFYEPKIALEEGIRRALRS